MTNNANISPISFSSEESRKKIDEDREKKAENKLVLEQMKIDYGCEHMHRIIEDFLIPVYFDIVGILNSKGILAEIVALDTQHPTDPNRLCYIGSKFRCGDSIAPCKLEFIADPLRYMFDITIRDPEGNITTDEWKFFSTIPLNIKKHVAEFLNNHFPSINYTYDIPEYEQYDDDTKAPFSIEMEDEGKKSELAKTETLKEAITMGVSFSKMFKDKPLHILNNQGTIIC